MASENYPEIVDRYAVYGALAAGGMATVHLGRLVGPAGFSRTVAIKRLRSDFLADPDFIAMFSDEARLAGRIRHPNVVAVIDVVSTSRELLLVMEYVQGETLSRLIQLASEDGGVVPAAIGAAIMRDTLAGLHAAHETKDEQGKPLGIIHRDVSPQNVIVGVDGVARVLDFGIAKALGRSHVTRDGNIKGKLAYMSPEQMQGGVSRATDIFAASIVLWEVLTGARLFRGETDAETVMKVMGAPIAKPSILRPSLGTTYDEVVMKGLSRDPSTGFQTAREMAFALAKAVELPDAGQVGEWVADIARARLSARDLVVADVESGTALSRPRISRVDLASEPDPDAGTRLTAETLSRPQAALGRRRYLAPLAATSLLLLAGGFFAVTRRPSGPSAAGSASSAALVTSDLPYAATILPPPQLPTTAPSATISAVATAVASVPPASSASLGARSPLPRRAPTASVPSTTLPRVPDRSLIPDHL